MKSELVSWKNKIEIELFELVMFVLLVSCGACSRAYSMEVAKRANLLTNSLAKGSCVCVCVWIHILTCSLHQPNESSARLSPTGSLFLPPSTILVCGLNALKSEAVRVYRRYTFTYGRSFPSPELNRFH